MTPVGGYCAFEGNACQWGWMALDGKSGGGGQISEGGDRKGWNGASDHHSGKVKTIKL